MKLKANDVIYYNGKIYVLVKEVKCSVINEETPHTAYVLSTLGGKIVDILLEDVDYSVVEILVRR